MGGRQGMRSFSHTLHGKMGNHVYPAAQRRKTRKQDEGIGVKLLCRRAAPSGEGERGVRIRTTPSGRVGADERELATFLSFSIRQGPVSSPT